MGTGFLAWACLLLATGAGDTDIVHFNMRGFQIPVRIDPNRRAEVHELILYLSKDAGRTWEIAMRLSPDKPGFDFMASNDGMHYFSIAVVDKRGVQEPADVYKAPVGQKILIDTTKPLVKILAAERVGDEVQVSWEAQDERPNWSTMKLEYRVGATAGGLWTPLPITQPGERGNLRFRPGLPGEVVLRLSLQDMAENLGTVEQVVSATTAAPVTPVSGFTPPGTVPPPSSIPPAPRADMTALPGIGSTPVTRQDAIPPAPAPYTPPTFSGSASTPATPNYGTTPSFNASSTTGYSGSSSMSPPAATPMLSSRGALPEVQIVNKKEAKIAFDVSRFGPSGLGSVEVYVTTDEGNTWSEMKINGGVQLPMPSELRGNVPVTGSVSVNLPRDGQIYGIYLIVRSRAGLGRPKPQSGDAPHIRLELDTTPPEAVLHMPKPDTSRSDTMVFTWRADDRNIAPNPITLQWAERPDGPWEFIGEPQLPNTGSYSWQVPERIPPRVYLQLTVRDRAGNASQARTPEPVPLDTRIPELSGVRLSK
ncbi:MAG: hypothetical protein EBV06_14080 [Planctomycetia bacterium]|nr:hypothetical protein [Planctomycetia bacterium]